MQYSEMQVSRARVYGCSCGSKLASATRWYGEFFCLCSSKVDIPSKEVKGHLYHSCSICDILSFTIMVG